MPLAARKCVPCKKGMPPLSRDQAAAYLKESPGWAMSEDGTWIHRKLRFKNFAEALAFVNKAGAIAEEEGHHPDFELGWGYVTVKLQTHDVGGLHDNDFVMAAKLNGLVG